MITAIAVAHDARILGNDDRVSREQNHVATQLTLADEVVIVERIVDKPSLRFADHENIAQPREFLKTAGERERLNHTDFADVRKSALFGNLADDVELRAVGLIDRYRDLGELHEDSDLLFQMFRELFWSSARGQNVADERQGDLAVVADLERATEVVFLSGHGSSLPHR